MTARRSGTAPHAGTDVEVEASDPLLALQSLVVEALRLADAHGFEEGIPLDAARLGIASRLRAAGMGSRVVEVDPPGW